MVRVGDQLVALLNNCTGPHHRCHSQARGMGKPVADWCTVCDVCDQWQAAKQAAPLDGSRDA